MLNCVNGSLCRVAAALVSAPAQFCPFGLECEAFVDGAFLVPTGRFYFTFFCLLGIIFKTLALA